MRSVHCLVVLATIGAAGAVHAASPLLSEDFENGSANWNAVDGNGVVISSDEMCSTHYQHETIAASGGRVFANSAVAVTGGNDYCVSAWVRASSDAQPFLGFRGFGSDGNPSGDHWLVGTAGFANGFGGTVVAVTADGAWHWYAAHVTLGASAASMMMMDELYQVAGGSADFDDISVTAGPCAAAYSGADQHQVCGNGAPVCAADGSCQPLPPPPADMSGGGAAPADMGAAPLAGNTGPTMPVNQPMGATTPTTPMAAASDGTTTASGTNRITNSGGCSVGGREGERSLAIMALMFVGVMVAGRRRRA